MNWSEIKEVLKKGSNKERILEKKDTAGTAKSMGINPESTLGQVVSNAREIYVNQYLRLCGSDNIVTVNRQVKEFYPGNKVVVATDAWGGFFVISNGDFEGHQAKIWYYSPDCLAWEETEMNYTGFISWVADGDLHKYYTNWMWEGFEEYIEGKFKGLIGGVKSNQAILVYPFLWSNECDINTAKKNTVPFEEIVAVNYDYERRLKK